MNPKRPHYLLFSEASCESETGGPGRWRFQLESVDGNLVMDASDYEAGADCERLELLAIVRGLEALDQPSRVSLMTSSRKISRGFRYGLRTWRDNEWQMERFGRYTPVRNQDLWRRIDHALNYHRVRCRTWKLTEPSEKPQATKSQSQNRNRAPKKRAPKLKAMLDHMATPIRQLANVASSTSTWRRTPVC